MTPIHEAKNLGPITAAELKRCGINSLEELREIGIEESFHRLVQKFPLRLNLNCIVAMYGATENIHWQKVLPRKKESLLKYLNKLKSMHKRGQL